MDWCHESVVVRQVRNVEKLLVSSQFYGGRHFFFKRAQH